MKWHEHLNVRLVIPILCVLAVSIGASLFWLSERQKGDLIDGGIQDAEMINEVIKASLRNQMLRRSENPTQDTIERIRRTAGLHSITLLDKNGKIACASDAARIGRTVDRWEPDCAACHEAEGLPTQSTRLQHTADGRQILRSMSLIANEPECRECHAEDGPYLGILAVDQGMDEALARIDDSRAALVGVGAMTLGLLAVVVFLILHVLVVRPVHALTEGTREVRRRNLETSIAVGVGGELGELADAFNEMVLDTRCHIDSIRNKSAELTTLYSIVERVTRSIDLRTLRRIVVDLLLDSFTDIDVGGIVVRATHGSRLLVSSRARDSLRFQECAIRPADTSELTDLVDEEVLSTWLDGQLEAAVDFGAGTGHVVPLRSDQVDVGLLILRKPRAYRLGKTERHLLEALSTHVTVALMNARLYALAITDELTQLYTVRFFQQMMAREVEGYHRYGQKVSLLMLDLDDFKRVNDEHGHPTGDRMLRRLAEVLTACVRDVDVVCRYGGEEFAIILPGTGPDAAQVVAQRIRTAVADTSFACDAGAIRATTSVGIASCPRDGTAVRELVDLADRALYAAKAAGKNRVRSAA